MMLDAKRTFDELIDLLAPDTATREEILANRIYQELSSAVAGSQEFTAVAKLYELDASGRFDAVVLDTPPSRSALDFLDAPQRLTGFLEGRALKVLTAPTGAAAAIAARGSGLVFSALRRITGVDLLSDLSTFFRVLSDVVDGFAERASAVNRLLGDPATTFLIVTSPEPAPVEEAIFFRRRLARGRNAVRRPGRQPGADAGRTPRRQSTSLPSRPTSAVTPTWPRSPWRRCETCARWRGATPRACGGSPSSSTTSTRSSSRSWTATSVMLLDSSPSSVSCSLGGASARRSWPSRHSEEVVGLEQPVDPSGAA